ncbi:MAG: hypothetical protein CMM46_00085 [Rhodospirillaceae bacterium]|nr:hypothetical protein [Rhodospirillaceae bacterium]|tara:strand:- start:7041 stop:7439 length:399 start_codon:yes stop_codon:yes gene_type:complete
MVGAMLGAHQPGDELGWHYDPNDGVVTLMVQRCSGGGCFEFAHMNRPDDTSEAVQRDAIDAVMSGQWPGTRQLDQKQGDFTILNGSRSLHRVTPVEAGPDRIMLLLSYDGCPDQVFSEDVHRDFFGRGASTR